MNCWCELVSSGLMFEVMRIVCRMILILCVCICEFNFLEFSVSMKIVYELYCCDSNSF